MTLHTPSPPSFDIRADSILSDTARILENAKAVQNAVVTNITPDVVTFENTLLPIIEEENQRLYEHQLIEFHASISPDEGIRDASNRAAKLFSQFDTETAWRKDLFALLNRNRPDELSAEARRWLEKYILRSGRNGLDLSEKDQVRLKQLNDELKELENEYLENCNQDCQIWVTEKDLQGVDVDLIRDLQSNNSDNDRGILVPLHELYFDIMSTAHRENTRHHAYTVYAKAHEKNVSILGRTIKLRDQKARLLGFPSYGHLRMAGNMEKSPGKMQAYLENLLTQLSPTRDSLVAKWRTMKSEDLKAQNESDDGGFYVWDRQYYSRKLIAEDFAFDSKAVSEYFELAETTKRMLSMFEKIMGLRFVEIQQSERDAKWIWHEDVRMFTVWDASTATQELLGWLYLDMYPRPRKRGGFACLPVCPVCFTPFTMERCDY